MKKPYLVPPDGPLSAEGVTGAISPIEDIIEDARKAKHDACIPRRRRRSSRGDTAVSRP